MLAYYPTAEEILAKPIDIKREAILTVKRWAKITFRGWKNKSNDYKRMALQALVRRLDVVYTPINGKVCTFAQGTKYSYNHSTKTLVIDTLHPSILSTLHEYGHHLYGESELTACRWSVWLFRTCFPITFSTMKWDGHMLKQKSNVKD